MELLVATLAYPVRGANEETLAQLRLVVDTMKNVSGMMNARLKRIERAKTAISSLRYR